MLVHGATETPVLPGRKRSFVFAIIATLLLMVAASAPSPFYPRFAEQLDLLPVAMTLIFAVYAFSMLTALLLAGGLSDIVGRRPVISVGAVLLAVSLLMFWHGGSLSMLIAARVVQGLAAGLLLPALSAMVVDSAPSAHSESASLWNTIAAMIGLGIGAISAAIILDVSLNPVGAVFGSVAIVFMLVAGLVWVTPSTLQRSRMQTARATSRLAVPVHLRRALRVAAPAIIAGWATNGLFLALGSSLVQSEFEPTTHAGQSIAIPVFAVSGIVASVVLHRRSARVVSLYGTSALGVGTALSLGALALQSFPAYLFTVAIVGTGFGTAFMGVLKTLMPRVRPVERAAVMAVIYTVSYLAFGVPTIVAGLLVPLLSLQGTMISLGCVIVALCVVATVQRTRSPELSHAT